MVLITGAASGIGHAVAELFAKEGATASDIASPENGYSEHVEVMKLDVTSEDDWKRAVDAIIRL